MKRAFLWVFGCFLPFATQAFFTDISEDYPYKEAISYAYQAGIIKGYEDGSFRPDTPINRVEAMKILVSQKVKNPKHCPEPVTYKDITAQAWYYPYLCYARLFGIAEGYPDNTFKPAKPINFAESAKMFAKTFGLLPQKEEQASANPWYAPYVDALAQRKAIPPSIEGLDKLLTRGEFLEIFYRLQNNLTTKPSLYRDGDQLKNYASAPVNCQHWFDGCQDCYRAKPQAELICIPKQCEIYEKPQCKFFFPVEEKESPPPKEDPLKNCQIWNEGCKQCKKESPEDSPLCIPLPDCTAEEESIQCLLPFPKEITLPEEGTRSPTRYLPFSTSEAIENLGKKNVAFFFMGSQCLECDKTERIILENLEKLPPEAIIFSVNFDTQIPLREKLRVPRPNTIVVLGKDKKVRLHKADFTLKDLIEALK